MTVLSDPLCFSLSVGGGGGGVGGAVFFSVMELAMKKSWFAVIVIALVCYFFATGAIRICICFGEDQSKAWVFPPDSLR